MPVNLQRYHIPIIYIIYCKPALSTGRKFHLPKKTLFQVTNVFHLPGEKLNSF